MAETGNTVPLAVDLDGTLIRTDMMWESLARLLRRNPLAIFQILFWWTRGRARLKQKLAARVRISPAELPYNQKFLAWLHQEKKAGRKLILATASDLAMAQPIADHVGIFDEVLASNGRVNLRSGNKVRALAEKFGERGFDYAGNSSADFAVWRGSREAVIVNASPAVRRRAEQCTRLGPVFCEDYFPLETAFSACRELFIRSGYLLALLAGVLLAIAFPKLNLAGFAWIAPALILFAAYGKSGADAFRVGFVSGFAFWITSIYWICYNPYGLFPILGWVALSIYLALFLAAWVWLVNTFKFENSSWSGRLLWSLGGAAAWVAIEMLRVRLLGGFPWSLLGVSQYRLVPLIQIASVTGVYGVSFLVAWFSLALFCAGQLILRQPTKRHVWQAEIAVPLLVVMACFVGGFFAMGRGRATDNFLQVTLIQPNIPQTAIWNPAVDENYFEDFLRQNELALGDRTNRTDLLLWPESAVPDMDAGNTEIISDLARHFNLWLILNGEDFTTSATATNYYNAAFLIDPHGRLAARYHKQKLVMFGEYIPLVHWLPFLEKLDPIGDGWTPGEKPVTFQLTGLNADQPSHVIYLNSANNSGTGDVPHQAKVGVLICFEDTFPGVARGAAQDDLDFFVNLTNDGWFGHSSEQWQHMANAVFRTVENGIPLLRCANNGITCYIDAHGRVVDTLRDPQGSEYGKGVLRVKVPLLAASEKSAPTFYNLHGDWFGWACVAWTILKLLPRLRQKSSIHTP